MCSIADYLVKSEEHMSRLADNMLDALTGGEHSRQLKETESVRHLTWLVEIYTFNRFSV